MPHNAPFVLSLSVWVPSGADRTFVPCEHLRPCATEELIQSCNELKGVLRAYGRVIARLLSTPSAPRYPGFRIVGRHQATGAMLAAVEWQRSAETRELTPYPLVWTSCQYVHNREAHTVA